MPSFTIDDRTLQYSLTGSGTPAVLTPGGRGGMNALVSTASLLNRELQLLEWDRCNTGASDVWIDDPSEQILWTHDIAKLVEHLGIGPAYFLGGSAGSRLAYLTAIHHPEVVRGLVMWSVSGGAYASQVLGYQYHTPFISAALKGGMEEVIETPHFQALVDANPNNRQRLLAMDPDHFSAVMHQWNESFFPHEDHPVIAASASQLRTIHQPTLVFGGNDDIHPTGVAEEVHELIAGSTFVPCAWSRDDFMTRYVGRVPESVLELYPAMIPTILDFIAKTEASRASG